MDRHDALVLFVGVLVFAVTANACAAKRAPVVTGVRTDGFVPAPGLFAERDVQYVAGKPHCIVRLTMAEAPESLASYVDVPMEWCEGVK